MPGGGGGGREEGTPRSYAEAARGAGGGGRPPRVVVVGGSKSACDTMVNLHDVGVDPTQVTWVYRKPYQFCKTVSAAPPAAAP
jgi:thioredoxin reductase